MARRRGRLEWYPWYPGDFYGDPLVRLMSAHGRGAYRELLDHAWQTGVLRDPERVLRSLGWDPALWEAELRTCWYEAEGGGFGQQRLEAERANAMAQSARAVAANESRHGTSPNGPRNVHVPGPNGPQMEPGTCPSPPPPPPPQSELKDVHPPITPLLPIQDDGRDLGRMYKAKVHRPKVHRPKVHRPEYSDDFQRWWAAYPRRIGKGRAWQEWQRQDHPGAEAMIRAVELACTSDQWQRDGGQYIPHPATWLHQRRWDDDPHPTTGPALSDKERRSLHAAQEFVNRRAQHKELDGHTRG